MNAPKTAQKILQQAARAARVGDTDTAKDLLLKRVNEQPTDAAALHLLGQIYLQLKQPDNAVARCLQALKLAPAEGLVWLSTIEALLQKGDAGQARKLLLKAQKSGLKGDSVDRLAQKVMLANLPMTNTTGPGQIQKLLQQSKPDQAELLARAFTFRFPDNVLGWQQLAMICYEQNDLKAAAHFLQKAQALEPDNTFTLTNLGSFLYKLDRFSEAETVLRAAVDKTPDDFTVNYNLYNVLVARGKLDETEPVLRKSIALQPDQLIPRSELLFHLNLLARDRSRNAEFVEQAREYGKRLEARLPDGRPFTQWQTTVNPETLRVGLVSADLCNHPVGLFLDAIVPLLKEQKLSLFFYAASSKTDSLTRRLQKHATQWRTLPRDDAKAADMIYADGIHVLLDLSGHTKGQRLPVFAYKPAPVQASWLGYFATTGVRQMDYMLGDPCVCPADEEDDFTETVWHLPESYLCFSQPNNNDFDLDALTVNPLPALQNGYIAFGSFNALTKMNQEVKQLWARVLQAVPSSYLFLKNRQLNDPAQQDQVRTDFRNLEIDPERLILEGHSPRDVLLASYHRVDIGLDPFPYPGGTTSAESLWMGVPVLTLRGDRFLSHVGESIAHNSGMSDWIAKDEDDYVRKAQMFSTDLEKLAALRTRLRHQVMTSPLFDAPRFAKHLAQALRKMYEKNV